MAAMATFLMDQFIVLEAEASSRESSAQQRCPPAWKRTAFAPASRLVYGLDLASNLDISSSEVDGLDAGNTLVGTVEAGGLSCKPYLSPWQAHHSFAFAYFPTNQPPSASN
jgi:hypothetical protein